MPGISVIVPVYQAEKLLPKCVESVQNQTFTDWELLLVDDGCTDGSPALCDRYAEEDSRVRALHQPQNAGVSAARNAGLDAAQGECIAFLDADDQYEPCFLETLWTLREESGADTAGCAHRNLWTDGSESVERLLPAGVYGREEIREKVVRELLGERLRQPVFNGFIWRFLYSTERIRQAQLRFEGAYLEDELFLLEYFCHAERLAVTEDPLYRYLLNPASATHRYMKHFQETFRRYLERKEELVERCGLAGDCPQWRENTLWAGLLIAIGNEYAKGNEKTIRERQETVQRLCQEPDLAQAIATYVPEGLGGNKKLVAKLVQKGHFGILTLLYRVKNRI